MIYKMMAAIPTAARRPANWVCLAAPATEVEVPVPLAATEEAWLAADEAPLAKEEATDEAEWTALVAPEATEEAPLAAVPTTPPMPYRVVSPMVEVRTELPEVMRVTIAEVVTAEEEAPVASDALDAPDAPDAPEAPEAPAAP
jgi:hypothetical protein